MRAYRRVEDHYEVKIERGRLVPLAIGAGLTLLLVFLVGVLVGKGLWGARQDLIVDASSLRDQVQEPTKPQYTFYEDLKRTDSIVTKVEPRGVGSPESGGETAVPGPKPPDDASRSTGGPADFSREASPVKVGRPTGGGEGKPLGSLPTASAKSPADEVKTSVTDRPPSGAKPAQTTSALEGAAKSTASTRLPAPTYTVQVGSFKDRGSADEQAKKIAGQAVSAQVVLVSMEGRTWFRVQVGRFGTRAEAEAHYQKKLRPKGIQGFVTTR